MSPRLYDPTYLYEVTRRADRGQMLFDLNNKGLNEAFLGVVAEAQRRYRVRVFHLHFMSTHYHGLFDAPTPLLFSRFLNFLHGRIAALINATRKDPGAVWSRKFRPLPVSKDEKTLMQRMDYLTGQAVRANLVFHPAQFPGASAVDWLLFGTPVVGTHRSAADSKSKAGQDAADEAGERKLEESPRRTVEISKLPGFEQTDWAELHPVFRAMADRIAGRSLAEVIAQGHPAKLAEVDQSRDQDDLGCDLGTPPPSTADGELTRGTHPEPCEPPAKLQLPDCTDPETGEPILRGPVRPKAGSRRRGRLWILTADERVREAYMDQMLEFAGEHGQAMARLRLRTAEVAAGIRLRAHVVFPQYSLLPGGLWQEGLSQITSGGADGATTGQKVTFSLDHKDFCEGHPGRGAPPDAPGSRRSNQAGQRNCRAPRAKAADSANRSSTSSTNRRVHPGALAKPPER